MRWKGLRESDQVEDRRGNGLPILGGGAGLVVIAIIYALLGGDPRDVLNASGAQQGTQPAVSSPKDEERKHFVSVVLANTEDVWTSEFKKMGQNYEKPKLVLFTGNVESACGFADAATGPFYCPGDDKVYIDLSFYDELQNRFGAKGDFAQAYVIAHEVGHHVQNLLGISAKVSQLQKRSSKAEANRLSVRLELQADFLAGMWAHHAQEMQNILDPADIDDAIRAATAIGDDRLQKEAQGYVVPESFTHGTSAQRVRWFRKGWDSGNLDDGDTFAARSL